MLLNFDNLQAVSTMKKSSSAVKCFLFHEAFALIWREPPYFSGFILQLLWVDFKSNPTSFIRGKKERNRIKKLNKKPKQCNCLLLLFYDLQNCILLTCAAKSNLLLDLIHEHVISFCYFFIVLIVVVSC